MASIIAGIVAVAKAIPVVDKWLQQLMLAYAKNRIDAWDKAIFEGIKTAIVERDQRDLEKAIGNPNAGEPSGNPGTSVRPGTVRRNVSQ